MAPLRSILAGTVGVSLATTAAAFNITHYPPAADSWYNLTWALNGTGSPGIYSGSATPDAQYGVYNWCNMPHVRKAEYKLPPCDYELKYVEVIQRHHKRTPYASNTFFKEDVKWDCSNEGPYAYARADDFDTTPVSWQAQTGTLNPFEAAVGPGFVGSTCQFPAITSEGLDDARTHGADLYGVYHDLLGFLPDPSDRGAYAFRVTNNVITSQTLSGFVAGLFPKQKAYAAWIQRGAFDSLEPAFSCPLQGQVNSAYEGSNPDWTAHLTASADLRARFNAVSGISADDGGGWHTSWDHPYDNLSAKQCHGKPLPCSVNATAVCVSEADADAIYRLGNWEYAYRWRGATNSTLYSALKMGAWFRELVGHMDGAVSGENKIKYLHNFAHDGSVSPVLGLLQIAHPVWPGMGSEVVFELWESRQTSTHAVRVLWGGQPLVTSTPLGTLDMVPYDQFVAYLDATIPADLVAACYSQS
ncbi:hypothetical protein Q8F55_006833 [Vanrija albida]|uniref:Acid phosphatase n=1 Tax=Vanrija albida TaxID=181172 RepID=A0ABR3PYM7_9TREE